MKLVITLNKVLSFKSVKSGVALFAISGALVGSAVIATPSQALPLTAKQGAANSTTLASYKIDYALWLAASKAWNVTRAEQVATHVTDRALYAKAVTSNHVATVAIIASRTSALAAAREAYLIAASTTTNATLRAKMLSVRTTAYAAIIASAAAQLASLPALGLKPAWPVAAARPIRPVKPTSSTLVG
jgi:hypothetical protein